MLHPFQVIFVNQNLAFLTQFSNKNTKNLHYIFFFQIGSKKRIS